MLELQDVACVFVYNIMTIKSHPV